MTAKQFSGWLVLTVIIVLTFIIACSVFSIGSGGLKRLTTLAGIYAVCRPDGYPVVCFADKGSKEGGIFCMPLTMAGGKCPGEN